MIGNSYKMKEINKIANKRIKKEYKANNSYNSKHIFLHY